VADSTKAKSAGFGAGGACWGEDGVPPVTFAGRAWDVRSRISQAWPLPAAVAKSRGLGLAFKQYREQPQDGIAFQMKQFKLPNDLAEAGYRSSVSVMEPELKPPDNSALDLVVKELAVRIEKAKTVTPAELRMVDDSIRLELVKEGLFKLSR
jgi:hypothetical protein